MLSRKAAVEAKTLKADAGLQFRAASNAKQTAPGAPFVLRWDYRYQLP
jgi:hypothetical protein